jgi:tripartite-type tricarboxylate transporter receptor subunit TctC
MARKFAGAVVVAFALATAPATAFTQQYPNKLIRIISPAPPGGGTDIIARSVGPLMQAKLQQTVIVENKPGAGGYLGSEAAADGHTLAVSGAFTLVTSLLHKSPAYDPRSDLIPVAVFASVPNMLVAGPRLKANSVAELIAQAKTNPGKLDMGSNGVGTSLHLTGELFQIRTGAKFVHVPYRGWADAMAALTTGEVDMMFDNLSTSLPNVRAGKIRALAVAAPVRNRSLPEVPTFAEAGVANADVISWFGLMVPKGTPKDAIAIMDRTFKEISEDPGFRQEIEKQGLDVTYMNSDAAGKFWQGEIEKWASVIKSANIVAE